VPVWTPLIDASADDGGGGVNYEMKDLDLRVRLTWRRSDFWEIEPKRNVKLREGFCWSIDLLVPLAYSSFGGICGRVKARVGCGNWHVRGNIGWHVQGGAARAESYEVARKAHRIAGVCQGGSGVRRQRWICRCVFVFGKSNRFCVRTKTGGQGWILK